MENEQQQKKKKPHTLTLASLNFPTAYSLDSDREFFGETPLECFYTHRARSGSVTIPPFPSSLCTDQSEEIDENYHLVASWCEP